MGWESLITKPIVNKYESKSCAQCGKTVMQGVGRSFKLKDVFEGKWITVHTDTCFDAYVKGLGGVGTFTGIPTPGPLYSPPTHPTQSPMDPRYKVKTATKLECPWCQETTRLDDVSSPADPIGYRKIACKNCDRLFMVQGVAPGKNGPISIAPKFPAPVAIPGYIQLGELLTRSGWNNWMLTNPSIVVVVFTATNPAEKTHRWQFEISDADFLTMSAPADRWGELLKPLFTQVRVAVMTWVPDRIGV